MKNENGRSSGGAAADLWVSLVLDESGSMSGSEGDVVGSTNSFVGQLRRQGGTTLVTLTTFNDEAKIVYANRRIEDVPELGPADYVPMGSTALLDAVGHTITTVAAAAHNYGGDVRITVMIMTDRHENASREYTGESLRHLIKSKEAEGNWTFVYLGADHDAYAAGESLGVAAGNRYNYCKPNTLRSMGTMAAAMYSLRHSPLGRTDQILTEEQKREIEESTEPKSTVRHRD